MNPKDQKRNQKLINLAKAGGTDKELAIMDAVHEIEDKFDAKTEELKAEVQDAVQKMADPLRDVDMVKIKGPKGDTGETGYTPVKSQDYFTPQDIEEVASLASDKARPVKGVDYKDGENGKDGKDSTIPGPKGDKGDQGGKGDKGADGKDGEPGKDGKDGKDGIVDPSALEDLRSQLEEVKKKDTTHRVISNTRNLYQLLDVDVSGITTDQSIKWNGLKWVPYTASGGGSGTVTSVGTAGLLSGGPITTSGTITTSIATNKLVGRATAGTGIFEAITLGSNLSFSGTTLNASSGTNNPGSPTNSLQFNSAGAFGGSSTLTFNGTDTITFGTEDTNATIKGPDAVVSGDIGGGINIQGGLGNGSGHGGSHNIIAGNGGNSGEGGYITIQTGNGNVSGQGGDLSAILGDGGVTGIGGSFDFEAGQGGATSGAGGSINLTAGSAQGGDSNGGPITISTGSKSGAGSDGLLVLATPTTELDIGDSKYDFGTLTGTGYRFLNSGNVIGANLDANSIASTDKTFTFPNQTGTFTVGTGVANLTTQTAAKTATTFFTPVIDGMYRISVYLQVTTAASVSSVLGGASGVVITYNDADGNVAQSDTVALMTTAGAIAITSAGNTTSTNLNGTMVINAKAGVAIQYAIGYTSTGTAMQYAAHLRCELI